MVLGREALARWGTGRPVEGSSRRIWQRSGPSPKPGVYAVCPERRGVATGWLCRATASSSRVACPFCSHVERFRGLTPNSGFLEQVLVIIGGSGSGWPGGHHIRLCHPAARKTGAGLLVSRTPGTRSGKNWAGAARQTENLVVKDRHRGCCITSAARIKEYSGVSPC